MKLKKTNITYFLTIIISILFFSNIPVLAPPPNFPPEILYKDAYPNPSICGESVRFEGRARDLENGTIYWTWDFADEIV